MKKLEQTNKIMQRLFDPRIKSFEVYVDKEKKQLHRSIPREIKVHYQVYYLQEHWEEICGQNLAKHCYADSLEGSTLTIKTTSSLFANELYMMKKMLLEKINNALAGAFIVKDLKFYTAGNLNKKEVKVKQAEAIEEVKLARCPLCGAKMTADKEICSVCEREKRQKLHKDLAELLKIQPWLSYDECQKYLPCERIAYQDVKEILENYYFEKVRLDYAEDVDKYMAVMFLTGKNITELDENIVSNSLEFLRRKQDVSSFRS